MFKAQILKIKANQYTYFIVKLIFLLCFIFILDYSIGKILKYLYFKQESGLLYRSTYSFDKTNEDILIFGSSRANHHYHPIVFQNKFNKSYYNVGRDGNFLLYNYAVLKSTLNRYSPNIIILDFNKGEFNSNQNSYDRLSSLLPYYQDHPEIQSIVNKKSKFEKFKLFSKIYPYNSLLFTILVGNMDFNKERKSDLNGYVPLYKRWNKHIENRIMNQSNNIDTVMINAYKSFIIDCKNAGVMLYIVCSPYFEIATQKDESLEIGKEIANKNGILFFDFSNDSIFMNNQNLFADIVHLNDSGAILFSNILINKIRKTPKTKSIFKIKENKIN